MSFLSQLTLSKRLLGGFSIVLAIAAAQSAVGLQQTAAINDKSTEIAESWLPSVAYTGELATHAADYRISQLAHVLTADAEEMAAREKRMHEIRGHMDAVSAKYEKLITSDQERQLYERFRRGWAAYLSHEARAIELSRAQKTDEAGRLLMGDARKAFRELSETLQQLVELNRAGSTRASAEGDALYARVRLQTLLAIALVVGLGLTIAWTVTRSVRRQLGGEPAATTEAVRRIAGGDLTRPIVLEPGDTTSLLAAMKDMQQRLTGIVREIQQSGESVATASAQIAQGNLDLSSRTEEQASALEQTAASMDQLGSTVRQNADNAQQANQLALRASSVAAEGGTAVDDVVQTMKGIEDSSRRIADIIGTIDGIAFQTNILALNAAVEAARAGDQGRGFAVVAGEVRSLAQRSAEAAKEIKSLIGASVERVEQGTVQVVRAGTTMNEVVGAIRRVTDIMGEISAASREQSAGVSQVGQAVSEMDRATQQNAALVEESAAAADSLRQQAQSLVRSAGAFRIEGSAP